MWVGLGAVALVLLSLLAASKKQSEVTSPSPTVSKAADVNVSPKATSSAKGEAEAPAKSGVKKLADTFGEYEVIALNNDNFWKISKRTCGTGIYYLSIKENNGYQDRALQPGDTIVVYCTY